MSSTTATQSRAGAVPFRNGANGAFELLLIRSSSGRWIFPKGKREDGETSAQAAARECLEEAGAAGAILPAPPLHYFLDRSGEGPGKPNQMIESYLLRVEHEQDPEDDWRDPTWFETDAAKHALAEDREAASIRELSGVVDWAATTAPGAAD